MSICRMPQVAGCLKLQDALSCRCLSAEEPLIIGLFCRLERYGILCLLHEHLKGALPSLSLEPMYHVARVNESCHVWVSHVTYEWVMSRVSESCHVWVSHVTYEWVVSRMNESCLTCLYSFSQTSHSSFFETYCIRHIMDESCHIWTSHVPNLSLY